MTHVTIPGYKDLRLEHLVVDFNGTLAVDGKLLAGVRQRLDSLMVSLEVHVVTADTFGRAEAELQDMDLDVVILASDEQDVGKQEFVRRLGPQRTACIGNGRNDRLMLKEAALSVAVVQAEGAAVEAVLAAQVVCPDILSALDLLANPLRLTATLRS